MLKFFRIPFAASGDRTAIPDAVDVNGNVSYTQGYGFDYQRQKTDPASKNIERDKQNSLFYEMTTAISELQAQGVPDFITSALNGGTPYSYSQYALVRDGGRIYMSLANANTAATSDPTKWSLLPVQANAGSLAAASTLDLNGLVGDYVRITAGSPTISAVTLREGSQTTLVFDAPVTLVDGATLALPGGENIAATAGTTLVLRGEAGGVVRCISAPGSGPAKGVFYSNAQTVTEDHTVQSTENAFSAGPITVQSGVTVTVQSGGVWLVL